MSVQMKYAAIAIAFAASLAYFFRYTFFYGAYLQFGDHYEGFIEISILEHWNNVFHDAAHWSQTNYFYPNEATLSYNDGYFIYGLIHSFFRLFSIDVLLSAELVNIVVRAAGFFCFYAAARRILDFGWGWALLGAVLFTISCGSYVQMFHAQLLTVCFIPALALLLHRSLQCAEQRRGFLLWGGAAVLFYAAWLMTAFYMAWFFALFLLVFAIAWLAFAPRASSVALLTALMRRKWEILALLALALIADLPFLQLYLPAAARTGMHSYQSAFSFSPSLLDMINVGDRNLLFGGLNSFLREHFRPGFPLHNEKTDGFPLFILTLFLLALLSCWRQKNPVLRALPIACCITWMMFLHVKDYSLYPYVYRWVPGAAAVRAIARYQLFLTAPLILAALAFLSRQKLGRIPLAVLALLLIAEEIDSDQIARINRPFELARLAAIPAPPADCDAFYVSRNRGDHLAGAEMDAIYSHSADAMLIAETIRLPTVNGFASFLPPGYDLFNPDQQDYLERVRRYAAQNHIAKLCSLDLRVLLRPAGGWLGPTVE